MINLPSHLIFEKNRIWSDGAWLLFLEIKLTDGMIIRMVNNTENIQWQSGFEAGIFIFTAFNFDMDWIEINTEGRIPAAGLKVSNVTLFLEQYLQNPLLWKGADIKINLGNSKYLDDYTSELELSYKVVNVSSDPQWVTFTLGGPNYMLQAYPPHKYMANHCRFTFRSTECGYSGLDTTCEKTIEACREKNNVTRFGAFVGLRSGTIRVA